MVLVALGSLLGRLEAVLGRSWAVLSRSWAVLGRSWAVLGRSWSGLGAILGRSRSPLGLKNIDIPHVFSTIFEQSRLLKNKRLKAVWDRSWAVLG